MGRATLTASHQPEPSHFWTVWLTSAATHQEGDAHETATMPCDAIGPVWVHPVPSNIQTSPLISSTATQKVTDTQETPRRKAPPGSWLPPPAGTIEHDDVPLLVARHAARGLRARHSHNVVPGVDRLLDGQEVPS